MFGKISFQFWYFFNSLTLSYELENQTNTGSEHPEHLFHPSVYNLLYVMPEICKGVQ